MNSETTLPTLIKISRWAALTCLCLLPLSVLGVRTGLLPVFLGLGLFALSALGGILVMIALVVLIMLPRFSAHREHLIRSIAACAVPVLISLLVFGSQPDVPAIHNISTDTVDPPQFEAAIAQRGDNSNPLEYTKDVAAIQEQAYPELGSHFSELSKDAAFDRALARASEMNWEVYAQDRDAGRIEAVETTFWFGFKDDIVIRVRAHGPGSRIDLRSVSRVGRSDLGANAARIRNFLAEFGN